MIIYYFILLIFTINTALASNFNKPNDIVNPLDMLSGTVDNCNDMSDTEPDDDEIVSKKPVSNLQSDSKEKQIALTPIVKKRPLNLRQLNYGPIKKAKYSHINRKFKCPYIHCGYSTNFIQKLKEHSKVHPTEKKYKCDYPDCSYATGTKSYLPQHKKIHGEKAYSCDQCDYTAFRANSVTKHKEKNHKIFKFKCDWKSCTYCTDFSGDFETHKRIHTGEKFFKCVFEGCEFAATHKSTLNRHMNSQKHVSVSVDQPFKCDYARCNYGTNRKWNLTRHKNVDHEGIKLLKCDYAGCNYTTADSNHLTSHINAHHKKKSAVINLLINAGKNKTN